MNLEDFFNSQLATWEVARNNYRKLDQVVYKSAGFETFEIRIQYNPDRIQSATAAIDQQSLKERPCFLCHKNMPAEQLFLPYNETFEIRVNPFPIFRRHFTVPAINHTDQLIAGHFDDMLSLAYDFQEYTVFYNGPGSGASAPDHLHFQLSPRHSLPLEKDVHHPLAETLNKLFLPTREEGSPAVLTIETIPAYIRKNLLIHSSDRMAVREVFDRLYSFIGEVTCNVPEPMMNLFVWFEQNEWWVVIFPRHRHRPWQFFAEGDDRIVFSPGCVDFAGIVISPRKTDFDRYTPPLLQDLFGQLTLDDLQWNNLVQRIVNYE